MTGFPLVLILVGFIVSQGTLYIHAVEQSKDPDMPGSDTQFFCNHEFNTIFFEYLSNPKGSEEETESHQKSLFSLTQVSRTTKAAYENSKKNHVFDCQKYELWKTETNYGTTVCALEKLIEDLTHFPNVHTLKISGFNGPKETLDTYKEHFTNAFMALTSLDTLIMRGGTNSHYLNFLIHLIQFRHQTLSQFNPLVKLKKINLQLKDFWLSDAEEAVPFTADILASFHVTLLLHEPVTQKYTQELDKLFLNKMSYLTSFSVLKQKKCDPLQTPKSLYLENKNSSQPASVDEIELFKNYAAHSDSMTIYRHNFCLYTQEATTPLSGTKKIRFHGPILSNRLKGVIFLAHDERLENTAQGITNHEDAKWLKTMLALISKCPLERITIDLDLCKEESSRGHLLDFIIEKKFKKLTAYLYCFVNFDQESISAILDDFFKKIKTTPVKELELLLDEKDQDPAFKQEVFICFLRIVVSHMNTLLVEETFKQKDSLLITLHPQNLYEISGSSSEKEEYLKKVLFLRENMHL